MLITNMTFLQSDTLMSLHLDLCESLMMFYILIMQKQTLL